MRLYQDGALYYLIVVAGSGSQWCFRSTELPTIGPGTWVDIAVTPEGDVPGGWTSVRNSQRFILRPRVDRDQDGQVTPRPMMVVPSRGGHARRLLP